MNNLPSLMYISQGKSPEEHIFNIKNFCVAGGKWVQLRMKNMPLDTYMSTAKVVQQICKEHDAILSINDHVEVALQTNTFGIHVGQNDIAPQIIRDKFLYKGVIGVTANTFQDISQCNPSLVAYIGLGPYKFTKTKKTLFPVNKSAKISGEEHRVGERSNVCARRADVAASICSCSRSSCSISQIGRRFL